MIDFKASDEERSNKRLEDRVGVHKIEIILLDHYEFSDEPVTAKYSFQIIIMEPQGYNKESDQVVEV
jgi:hypothetical protein